MRAYEIMLIARSTLDEDALNALLERVEQLITKQGGRVDETDVWGKRRLAYEIDDIKEGAYVVIDFHGGPAVTSELDRILKLTDDVLRHLIVAKEA